MSKSDFPPSGGSWVRDPVTGAVSRAGVAATEPAAAVAETVPESPAKAEEGKKK